MKIDGKEYIELFVHEVKHETDEALLVDFEGEECWIPKSQLEDWPDVGDEGYILIAEWMAEKKGMI